MVGSEKEENVSFSLEITVGSIQTLCFSIHQCTQFEKIQLSTQSSSVTPVMVKSSIITHSLHPFQRCLHPFPFSKENQPFISPFLIFKIQIIRSMGNLSKQTRHRISSKSGRSSYPSHQAVPLKPLEQELSPHCAGWQLTLQRTSSNLYGPYK